MSFFSFPHTPHLAWLGEGRARRDKLLDPEGVRDLLRDAVTVEEKVDGANLGFSVDDDGELRAQSRGAYLTIEEGQGQWKPLKRWLNERRHALVEALFPDLMLFGEWCYAVHSIHYTRLPDWFLVFDVYDRATERFWDVTRRDALAESLGLFTVPVLGHGTYSLAQLEAMLGMSRLTDGPAEGIYVRRDVNGHLDARAKIVRSEFVQAIDVHWSKAPLRTNELRRT